MQYFLISCPSAIFPLRCVLIAFLLKIDLQKLSHPILGQCFVSIPFENIRKQEVLGFNGDVEREHWPDIVYYYMSQDIILHDLLRQYLSFILQ